MFDHVGPWTEDAYLALDGHDGRAEVVDGTLLIGPDVTAARAQVVSRLAERLRSVLPAGLNMITGPPLRLSLDTVLIPDLVITNMAAPASDDPGAGRRRLLDATDTLMVIEVVGSDHGLVDRSFKSQVYARSRIPYALLIDHDAPFAVAEMILGGRYHEYAAAGVGGRLRLDEPFGLDLDLTALTARADPADCGTPAAS